MTFGVLQSLAVGAYAWPAMGGGGLVAITLVDHFAGGLATAALFTWMMDACRPDNAATDYTLQASVVVIATGIAAAVSGVVAQQVGYTNHFLLSGGLALCGALFVVTRLELPR